jgi:hypothetical protein
MAQQRLHSNLAEIDLLTREELASELSKHADQRIMQELRGLDILRFPRIVIPAAGTTLNLGSVGNNEAPCGPEQGDIWSLSRVIVKSNVFTDTAKYILFRGSTPSDIANAYGLLNLLEGFAAAGGGQPVGVGYYPSRRSVYLQPGEQIYALVTGATAGNVYQLDGEGVRAPAEMKGKIV